MAIPVPGNPSQSVQSDPVSTTDTPVVDMNNIFAQESLGKVGNPIQSPPTQNQQQPGQQTTQTPSTFQAQSTQTPLVFDSSKGQAQTENFTPIQIAQMVASGQLKSPEQQAQPPAQTQVDPAQQFAQMQQLIAAQKGETDTTPTATAGDTIATNLIKSNGGMPDFLSGVDVDEALTKMTEEGDPKAFTGLISKVGENAYQQALSTFFNVLPELKDAITEQVMSTVQESNEKNNDWNEFVKEYPAYANYKETILPSLENMANYSQIPKAQARATVAQMFSGLVNTIKPADQREVQAPSSSAFDIAAYLQN